MTDQEIVARWGEDALDLYRAQMTLGRPYVRYLLGLGRTPDQIRRSGRIAFSEMEGLDETEASMLRHVTDDLIAEAIQ